MSAGVRLVVDAARCDGHGICALRCPDLVALDQWGFARVDGQGVVERAAERRARRAVAACPVGALSLVAMAESTVSEAPPRLHLIIGRGPEQSVAATATGSVPMHNRARAGN